MKFLFPLFIVLGLSGFALANDIFLDEDTNYFKEYKTLRANPRDPNAEPERVVAQKIKTVEYIETYDVLIKHSKLKESYSTEEEFFFKSNISAFERNSGNYKKLWEIEDNSFKSEIVSSYLRTTNFALCCLENIYNYYSLTTGKLIVQGTSDPVAIYGRVWTNIIYLGENSGELYKGLVKNNNINGVIYLLVKEEVVDKIYVTNLNDHPWTPEIVVKSKNDPVISMKFESKTYHLTVKGNSIQAAEDDASVFKKSMD